MKKWSAAVLFVLLFFLSPSLGLSKEFITLVDGSQYPLLPERIWQEDLDGDGRNEEITLWRFSAGGNMGLFCNCLSISKDGRSIFPAENERSFCNGKFLFQDIDPRFQGKEVMIFQPQTKRVVKIFYYALQSGQYTLYNCDLTDQQYKKIDIKKIMAEIKRGTKFQRALRVAESYLAALKKRDWKRAKGMIGGKDSCGFGDLNHLGDVKRANKDFSKFQLNFLKSKPPEIIRSKSFDLGPRGQIINIKEVKSKTNYEFIIEEREDSYSITVGADGKIKTFTGIERD